MSVFTRLVITAPSEKISDVYRLQLASLQSQLACLKGCSVHCVSDPKGYRVGSGGGTLNAIDDLLAHSLIDVSKERILIIHSGGDSRRAPLYSLCGKAWTTLNSVVGSSIIANPLTLLIEEISKFCSNLPLCSLVVASSDVMLDIICSDSGPEVFAMDSVSVVSVAENPQVAKNHGVLVLDMKTGATTSKPYVTGHAVNYLQKPSVEQMAANGAIYPGEEPFALIDTGVVIFTGEAFRKFISLTKKNFTSNCTSRVINSLQEKGLSNMDIERFVLRVELYSDILLALRLSEQTSMDMSVYLNRLGLQNLSGPPSSYQQALPVIWETLSDCPLHVIHSVSGRFNHLGTSQEVLELLLQTVDQKTIPSEGGTSSHKLSRFAEKYSLQRSVRSQVDWKNKGEEGVAVNTIAQDSFSSVNSLVEHSLLTSTSLGTNTILSHIGSALGRNLTVNQHIMMQQVFLKEGLQKSSSNDFPDNPPGSECVLLVMNIHDDVKKCYKDVLNKTGVVMGSSWSHLFSVGGVSPDDIWDAAIPDTDRSLWNARLFSKFRADTLPLPPSLDKTDDEVVNIEVFIDGAFKTSSRLTLTWLQDLNSFNGEKYAKALKDWMNSERLSLSDLLSYGDAKKMFFWRLLLQSAVDLDYGLHQRAKWVTVQDQTDSKAALNFIFESTNDLFKHVQRILASVNVSYGHGMAASVSSFLWSVKLLSDLDEQNANAKLFLKGLSIFFEGQISSEVAEEIVDVFFITVARVDKVANKPETSALFAEYLRRLMFGEPLLPIATALLTIAASYSTIAHPRVLFLVSWLLKDDLSSNNLIKPLSPNIQQIIDKNSWDELGLYTAAILEKIREGTVDALCSSDRDTSSTGVSFQSSLEAAAQAIVSAHVQYSLHLRPKTSLHQKLVSNNVDFSSLVLAESPVRIDLAGGWSDTPPICYEMSGSVLNVAITVDNQYPIRCASRLVAGESNLRLVTVRSLQDSGDLNISGIESVAFQTTGEVETAFKSNSQAWYSLVLAALVVLEVVDFTQPIVSISTALMPFLSSDLPHGLEIGFKSTLPAGSGMGGSSVLAATILMSVGTLLGLNLTKEDLVYLVSQVEQVLTTGGGWQDQVGAIYGGFKIARSPKLLPLRVSVSPATVQENLIEAFEKRTFLLYTGQQRLAKNTLINALRKCALIPANDPNNTVAALIQGAEKGFQLITDTTFSDSDDALDALAAILNDYWTLKKEMAAGSEPPHIKKLLGSLRPFAEGLSLCGAGAGGFAVIILKREASLADLEALVRHLNGDISSQDSLSVHTIKVDRSGIKTSRYNDSEKDVLFYLKD